MWSTSSFFVRQRRAVSPSRPAILDGAARSGWSRLAGAHRRRRLGLDHPEHGATLGYRRASLLANLLSRTDDRVAKSRARGESPAAQPYCRSSFEAPVRAFGPLAFHPATNRAWALCGRALPISPRPTVLRLVQDQKARALDVDQAALHKVLRPLARFTVFPLTSISLRSVSRPRDKRERTVPIGMLRIVATSS